MEFYQRRIMQDKKSNYYFPNFPIKPIKHILKNYYNGEISEDTCYYVRDILLKFTEILAKEAVKEFKNSNNVRQKYGIPKIKRLDKASFIEIWDRLFKIINIPNMGKVGKNNKILLCQDGVKNE
jgi:hypothetical protein